MNTTPIACTHAYVSTLKGYFMFGNSRTNASLIFFFDTSKAHRRPFPTRNSCHLTLWCEVVLLLLKKSLWIYSSTMLPQQNSYPQKHLINITNPFMMTSIFKGYIFNSPPPIAYPCWRCWTCQHVKGISPVRSSNHTLDHLV